MRNCNWYTKVQTSKVVDKTHHSVFPFTFGGKTYDGCTRDGSPPWAPYSICATKVDDDRNALDVGICDPNCPGVGKIFFNCVKNPITGDPHIS